jgi:amino acid transporter
LHNNVGSSDPSRLWLLTTKAREKGAEHGDYRRMTTNPRTPQPFVRKATLLSFVFVMYSYTTGGPFGLEEQVSSSGPGMTLLYHLLIPFLWCIPISLVAAELTTAMPVQGGFYRWVRAAFGDFWGFLAGWWNWTASFQVFGVGLALGVWLYSGYEQLSTVAEEVENPRRTFPRGLALVVPLSIATYFLPTFASLAALDNWQQWHGDYFSVAAKLIGGPLLGAWVALAAMVTNAALLNSTVLATTRMPYALAEDKFLPSFLTRVHPRFGTPAVSIIVSGAVYAAFAMFTLTQLIAVYAWLRVATSVMTVLAAWKLRQVKPEMPRPFVIPGGRKGLLYAVGAPVLLGIIATGGSVADSVQRNDRLVLLCAPAAILLGPLAYAVSQWSRRRSSA